MNFYPKSMTENYITIYFSQLQVSVSQVYKCVCVIHLYIILRRIVYALFFKEPLFVIKVSY